MSIDPLPLSLPLLSIHHLHLPTLLLLLLLLLPLHFPIRILVVAPQILDRTSKDDIDRDPHNEEEPEEVDGLEAGQEGKGDPLGAGEFIDLPLPVEVPGTEGAEGGEDGVEDAEVDVVAHVDPDADEGDKPGHGDGRVDVVEGFGHLGALSALLGTTTDGFLLQRWAAYS